MKQKFPKPLFDTSQGAQNQFGDLPEWNLDDLYTGEDAAELTADWKFLETEIPAFAQDYEGKLATLNGDEWAKLIERLEKIQQVQGRIMSFAGLRYYQLTTDPNRGKFMADAQARLTDLGAALVFFELEVNQVPEENIKNAQAANQDFARYQRVFERMRAMKPYQLSDELEKFLHDQSVVGAAAWNRLFDETMAAMSFEFEGETIPLEALLTKTSDKDRSIREKASRALGAKLTAEQALFARITNTLAKEKEVEDRWRKLPFPAASRHLANDVEPEVVDALRNSVINAYPKISHRYYALKAKWMGLDKLETWDRNAPLPDDDDHEYSWEEARSIVQKAYGEFDPRMA